MTSDKGYKELRDTIEKAYERHQRCNDALLVFGSAADGIYSSCSFGYTKTMAEMIANVAAEDPEIEKVFRSALRKVNNIRKQMEEKNEK